MQQRFISRMHKNRVIKILFTDQEDNEELSEEDKEYSEEN